MGVTARPGTRRPRQDRAEIASRAPPWCLGPSGASSGRPSPWRWPGGQPRPDYAAGVFRAAVRLDRRAWRTSPRSLPSSTRSPHRCVCGRGATGSASPIPPRCFRGCHSARHDAVVEPRGVGSRRVVPVADLVAELAGATRCEPPYRGVRHPVADPDEMDALGRHAQYPVDAPRHGQSQSCPSQRSWPSAGLERRP